MSSKNKEKVSQGSEIATLGESPIVTAFDKISALQSRLKHIQESAYRLAKNYIVPGFSVPIQDETKIEELIKMHSITIGRERSYQEAAKDLEVETYPVFRSAGATLAEIKDDIKLRIAFIGNKEQLEKLKDLKKRYEELMDKDDKLRILNDELSKL